MQYTSAQAHAYLRQHLKWEAAKEYRHQNTRQGAFERAFIRYDAFADIDPDHNQAMAATNDNLEAAGRRDFTLLSPADQVQLKLDFDHFEDLLLRTNIDLLLVFRTIFYGYSWQDLGMPKQTWSDYLKILEDFLGRKA